MRNTFFLPSAGLAAFGLGLVLAIQAISNANAQSPSLQIISPSDGAVVHPGQLLNVTVVVTGGSFIGVQVVGEKIGISPPLSAPPYQFTLRIPESGLIGYAKLTAAGATGPEAGVFSEPVTINVVPSRPLVSMNAQLRSITFDHVGQQFPLSVVGKFGDGSSGVITRAPGMHYWSNNVNVVSVDASGVITAVSPGKTIVIVHYDYADADVRRTGRNVWNVAVSVPGRPQGDLDGNGKVDRDDLDFLLRSLNDPATGPLDARDLNKDGIIDAEDVRLLLELCGFACTVAGPPYRPPNAPDSGTNCNGIYNGRFIGNLSISDGQTCTYVGNRIEGNVTQNGGTLVLVYTAVSGSVQITGGGNFAIGASAIGGNLEIGNLPAGPGLNSVCGSQVQGNLQPHNNAAPVQIGSSTASCTGNSVRGDLQVNNNTAPTTVFNNNVGNNLQCQNNSAITGAGNSAKQKQGQCSAF
jgi:hypothetical protein